MPRMSGQAIRDKRIRAHLLHPQISDYSSFPPVRYRQIRNLQLHRWNLQLHR